MADFCTLAHVEDFLQYEITDTLEIASVARAIGEATAAIKNYCEQVIELVSGDTYVFDVGARRSRLLLPELPVVAVASVVEDGVALVAGADEDYQLGQHGILHRVGQFWAPGIQIVAVTYTHGYDTAGGYVGDPLPDDIVGVATRAAARAFQAGKRSAEAGGVPGVVSKSLGDYAVGYTSETGGGVSEGVLGASAARILLLSEKDILDKYKPGA